MMQLYLINALIFCGIILLLVLIVGAIQVALLLLDVRKTTREVKDKIYTVLSLFDIFSLIFGGLKSVKHRLGSKLAKDSPNLVGFIAGLKKALQVLLNK